ncbi:MAG: 2-hydroxyacid dehydrogenase [Candidatus Omnitrophota bacterium]
MKIAIFSTKPYSRDYLERANRDHNHDLKFLKVSLTHETVPLAEHYDGICIFVNDVADRYVLEHLAGYGVKLIVLRSAGYNNVDLDAAKEHGIKVARVPAYSPYGVAEHAAALILSLNRKIYKAYNRVRDSNFELDGLLGFEVHGCTVGVVGTGKIGALFAQIMNGFGVKLLGYDPNPNQDCLDMGMEYVSLDDLCRQSDILSLHAPLMKSTYHMINDERVNLMKDGVMLINTSRGGLVDTSAVIRGLKSGKIGYLGLDVYEEEGPLFFEDQSTNILQDDTFARLLTFPNVVITGHQAFFTGTALGNIADTTMQNIRDFKNGKTDTPNFLV